MALAGWRLSSSASASCGHTVPHGLLREPNRPHVRTAVAVAEPASTSAAAGRRHVYLERIPDLQDVDMLIGPSMKEVASTSGRIGPAQQRKLIGKRNLAINGHYMVQVRLLGNIFSRARSQAEGAAAVAPTNPNQQQQSQQQQPATRAAASVRSSVAGQQGCSAASSATSSSPDQTQALGRLQAMVRKPKPGWGPRRQQGTGKVARAERTKALHHSGRSRSSSSTGSTATVPLYGVEHILTSYAGSSGDPLEHVLKNASPVARHHALLSLGSRGQYNDVQRLVQTMTAAGCVNEHTNAVALHALDRAGRFDLALQHFEALQKRDLDVGPVCSSMLIKLCAQRRDLRTALDIFYRLLGQSTLNRYTYNCLIHLCAMLGEADEAMQILQIMREDGGEETSPDACTCLELLKAVVNGKRWQLLPRVCKEIQRAQVRLAPEHWTLIITAAGRASEPQLAQDLYRSAKAQYSDILHIDNALLAAVARHVPLSEMLAVYRNILLGGLHPDEYTFNAILTSMCKTGASLYAVEDLLGEMYKWGVKINTYTGTSLISAYRRAPEMNSNDPRMTALLLEKVHDVLTQLIAERQANTQTFGLVMTVHAQLGDVRGVFHLLRRMQEASVRLDGKTCLMVASSFEEGGFFEAAQQFLLRTDTRHLRDATRKPAVRAARRW